MSRTRNQPPNVFYVFADQWRADALGYAGDPNVRTPCLDALADRSINFTHAVAGCPVCAPARASLLTGQYPDTHGVFLNDVCLTTTATTLPRAFASAGYDTAYIGKWHLDGHGRSSYIPPVRRQGFDFFKVLECTHQYNQSHYYAGNDDTKLTWEGYDAIAQTRAAAEYLRSRDGSKPFFLALSWGPPHNPYHTAPPRFTALYRPEDLRMRPNVPPEHEAKARVDLAGYYAHISALDSCVGDLLNTLRESGLLENTLFIFTSDHGDMVGSQGLWDKQCPWDESIRVPLLVSHPARFGTERRRVGAPINTPDIMPTLLDLCGLQIPGTVQGKSFAPVVKGAEAPTDEAALIACYAPFATWNRKLGGREYRGLRTPRYTYARALDGPWLLYDNAQDPFQLRNLCHEPEHAALQTDLDGRLDRMLEEAGDEFLPADAYIQRWGYTVDENGAVPITQ